MRNQNICYACDYEPNDAVVVSRALALLIEVLPLDHMQMEWVPDNDRYEEGLKQASAGIRSQVASGQVRLDPQHESIDEEWLIKFAPWSFSAELYDRPRRVLIDIADASSLTVELRFDSRIYAHKLLDIFELLELRIGEM